MLIRTFIAALLIFLFSGHSCIAQRFVALDVTKVTGFKRYKYYIGDEIKFKSKSTNKRYKGTIVMMSDSVIYFGKNNSINVNDIEVMYRDNSTFVNRGLGKFCLVFGPGFLCLDTFNNLINNRKPLVNDIAVKEGAAFTGVGIILTNMMKRHYKMGKRRSIKIMDLDLK